MSEKLKLELNRIKRECLKIIPEKQGFDSSVSTKIRFAGAAYAEACNENSICSVCKKPLSFIFQFYSAKPSQDISESLLLAFFYCFECIPIGSPREDPGSWAIKSYMNPSVDKFIDGHGVDTRLKPFTCRTETVFMLPDYETIENNYSEIAELCEEIDSSDPASVYEDIGLEINCEVEPFTSIGGYPIWIQGESEKQCPVCKKEMSFIAQIDSQAEVDLMWGDAGSVYLFQCPEHHDQFDMEMQCF